MLMASRGRGRVHDRTTRDVPFNAVVATVEVDDPLALLPDQGKQKDRLRVTVSLRDDPLGRLHARRQIPVADYMAGRHYQRLCEDAEVGGLKAMDTTKEPVDGSQFPLLITDKQRKAVLRLQGLAVKLGQEGEAITRDFLAHRLFIKDIAEKRGFSSSDMEYLGRRLRECLGTLARELGYSTRRRG